MTSTARPRTPALARSAATIVLLAACAVCPASPDPATSDEATPIAIPWPKGEGGRVVRDASGLRYAWPPVSDLYLQATPLEDIFRWLQDCWSEQASKLTFASREGQPRIENGATCVVVQITPRREPLTETQWNSLAVRGAERLENAGPHELAGVLAMLSNLTQFPPEAGSDAPTHGYRAVSDEALRRCAAPDAPRARGLPFMAAGFAGRAQDTTFLRRAMGLLREAEHPLNRAALAEAAAEARYATNDLSDDELRQASVELLQAAAQPGVNRVQRIGITDAALNYPPDDAGALDLIDSALASDHDDIRATALRNLGQRARLAREAGRHGIEPLLKDRLGRVLVLTRDPSERVRVGAVHAVSVLLEPDPAAAARALTDALDLPDQHAVEMAIMYLIDFAEHDDRAIPRLRELAATGDPAVRTEAANALAEIERRRREPDPG